MTAFINKRRSHEVIMKTTAMDWRGRLPHVNGWIGAMHFGNVFRDLIQRNHEALWAHGRLPKEVPDGCGHFPELHRMLRIGRYVQDNEFLPNKRGEGNRYAEARDQPWGHLFIELAFRDASRDFHRMEKTLVKTREEVCVEIHG
ncbi:MAG: hypothetical protein D6820_15975 [Lentisphaerae bacterium]|nr:MAG: hypothetical protein D6820_15975 [Lentisphaerota bacterium]